MNANFIDLTSKKFGEWTVLKLSDKIKIDSYGKRKYYWTCQCSCGNIYEVQGNSLKAGRSTKCRQCANNLNKGKPQKHKKRLKINNKIKIKKGIPGHPKLKDISGKIYPNFTVISYHHSDNQNRSYWLCKCNHCGLEKVIQKNSIIKNKISSCGCVTSKGEIKITKLLQQFNINFQKEFTFSDLKDIGLLRFDFAIFNDKNQLIKLIEYQGRQHYEEEIDNKYFNTINLKKHDKMKKDYCKKHNIKLLEIPYWDYDKIDINYLLNN